MPVICRRWRKFLVQLDVGNPRVVATSNFNMVNSVSFGEGFIKALVHDKCELEFIVVCGYVYFNGGTVNMYRWVAISGSDPAKVYRSPKEAGNAFSDKFAQLCEDLIIDSYNQVLQREDVMGDCLRDLGQARPKIESLSQSSDGPTALLGKESLAQIDATIKRLKRFGKYWDW